MKVVIIPILTSTTKMGWYWRIVADNGETLAHSETYPRRWSARRTAKIVAKALNVELEDQS